MGSEEAETRAKYERVCRELNLDQLTMDTAWKDYKSINEDYVLEVQLMGLHVRAREKKKSVSLCADACARVLVWCARALRCQVLF